MGTRTPDLRPTKVHGQPRSTAIGPVGSLPRRSRSIGQIITPWLGIVLVALGVEAVAGPPLHAAAATAAPHGKAAAGAHRQATAKPPEQPTATPTACSNQMNANGPTWMHDLDPCIRYRRLTDIVIPGSHDSATYSLPAGAPGTPYAQTQSVDLKGQLNAGARQFDIRVEYAQGDSGTDYYAHHGSGATDQVSTWLTLSHPL